MTPRRTSLTYAMFVVMLVLAALDQTILATALPSITSELQGHSQLSWVFSAYLIASTVVVPLYGKLADIHGSKPLLLTAIGLFLLGSLACGFAGTMDQLIIARAIQGAGGGGLMTLTMLGVVDLYPLESRGKYQAMLGASYGLSTMFGPLVGGYVVEHLSWHWTFFMNVPPALLALAALGVCFRPPAARHPHPVDYLGATLLTGVLVSLLLATRRSSEEGLGGGIDTPTMWRLLALAGVLAVAFVVVERRVKHPLLPLSMFRQRAFSAASFVSAATGVVLFSAVVFLPLYLQTGLGFSPSGSAWQLLPVSMGITLAAIVSGKRLREAGRVRNVAVLACGLSALSFGLLALLFRFAPTHVTWMSVCLFPLGLGIGALFPLITVVSQFSVPPQMIGVGTSTPIMLRTLGGALGVAALGSLLTHGMTVDFTQPGAGAAAGVAAAAATGAAGSAFAAAFASGIQPVYAIGMVVCALAGVAAWFLPERLARPTAPQVPLGGPSSTASAG